MCDVITMSTVADVRFLCIRVVYQLSLILGSIIVHLLYSMGCQMHTYHLFFAHFIAKTSHERHSCRITTTRSFVRNITGPNYRSPVNSLHQGLVMRKAFLSHNAILLLDLYLYLYFMLARVAKWDEVATHRRVLEGYVCVHSKYDFIDTFV